MVNDSYAKTQGKSAPYLLRSPILESMGGVTHTFTTRWGGVSSPPFDSLNLSSKTGDSEDNCRKNEAILADALSISGDLFFLEQVHGDTVLLVEGAKACSGARSADAAITNTPGIPLLIRTADCLPVLLYDPVKNAVGAVHAGWRGTAAGIAKKTVLEMMEKFGCRAPDILAATGPAIGPCCYEVDEAVREGFIKNGNEWEVVSRELKGGHGKRWMLDLAGANTRQLISAGVAEKNISISPCCTCCREDLFYSHRRDGKMSGRQGALIMID